jgi:hypothetical protein
MWKKLALGNEEEARLRPDDFDRALRRMKSDLALLDLRRQLLHRELGASEVLALTQQILELQRPS